MENFIKEFDVKICPRCKGSFECKANNIVNCQCAGISFTAVQKAFIIKNYKGCLCRKCLLELSNHQEIAEAP